MIENCSSPSQMIPVVQPRTQAQRELWEKKDPFFIPEYVGGRFAPESWASGEERCVFVLFFFFFLTLGSSYESGLALGSTLIAGGLQATWGPEGPPEAIRVRATDCIMGGRRAKQTFLKYDNIL